MLPIYGSPMITVRVWFHLSPLLAYNVSASNPLRIVCTCSMHIVARKQHPCPFPPQSEHNCNNVMLHF